MNRKQVKREVGGWIKERIENEKQEIRGQERTDK